MAEAVHSHPTRPHPQGRGSQPGLATLCWAGANPRLPGYKRPGGCAFKEEQQKTTKLSLLSENRPQVEQF